MVTKPKSSIDEQERSGGQEPVDRGQLLLIGAITIGVVVLVSVAVLNSVHSSPNINTKADAQALSNAENADIDTGKNLASLFEGTLLDNEPLFGATDQDLIDNIDTFESSYNTALTADRSHRIEVTYGFGSPGAVAYNRSVNTSDGEEAGLIENLDPNAPVTIPRVSFHATEVDATIPFEPFKYGDGASGTPLVFVDPGSAIGVSAKVIVGDPATGQPVTCEFANLEELHIELRGGAGTVSNETSTCTVSPDASPFVEGPSAVALFPQQIYMDVPASAVNGTLSYEVAGATNDPSACVHDDECVDSSDVSGTVDVNPTFQVSVRGPGISYGGKSYRLISSEIGQGISFGSGP